MRRCTVCEKHYQHHAELSVCLRCAWLLSLVEAADD